MHFSKLMARPLVAKALKKASRWRRCVCLSGEPTRESSMYANTPSRPSVVRSIILWKVCAALDSPKGVKQAKWHDDCSRNGDLVITLDKINF